MNNSRTALILIACAALLAAGAYFIMKKPDENGPVHRAEVAQPPEAPTKAPDWVNGGQDAKPDYTPSTAEPAPEVPVEEETQTIEISEDSVVTFTFVESLADFLLNRFQPKGPRGKPATLVSIIELNRYYGRELDGFSIDPDDINASRKHVLDYAFNPIMIKTLYNLYSSAFLIHLVDTAVSEEREYTVGKTKEIRTLTNDEVKVMLRLNSRRIERSADLFRAIGTDPSFTEMAAKYRRLAKAVERANSQLQDAIADEKNAAQASNRLKQAILQREQAKQKIITQLKQVCHSCSESEVFYLSEWAYRRVQESSEERLKAFTAAADALDDLAIRFRAQAEEIK